MKKKRFLSVLIIITMLLIAICFSDFLDYVEAAEVYGDYEYTVSGQNATITKYNGSSEALIIPNQIDGYTVTAIGNRAFEGCESIKSIVLPENIAHLGYSFISGTQVTSITIPKSVKSVEADNGNYGPLTGAMELREVIFEDGMTEIPDYMCRTVDDDDWSNTLNNIETIRMPDSIEKIGAYAFYGCDQITEVVLPKSLKEIGRRAYSDCDNLSSVQFVYNPEKEVTIGNRAFEGCESIKSIVLPENVAYLGYSFISGTQVTSITIPKSVKSVGADSYGNYGKAYGPLTGAMELKEVIFEDGMTEIPAYMCRTVYNDDWSSDTINNIETIRIPNSIEKIGDYAFYGCDQITEVTLPTSLKKVGALVYYDCDNLVSVQFEYNPEREVEIGRAAFGACGKLSNIRLTENVTYIGDRAFEECVSIKNILLPGNVTYLGYSFISGTQITSITIPKSVKSVGADVYGNYGKAYGPLTGAMELKEVIFEEGMTEIPAYMCRTVYNDDWSSDTINNIKTIQMPDSIEKIGDYAFYGCDQIVEAILPKSLKEIGRSAYFDCDNLNILMAPRSVTSINSNAFSNCDELTIYGYANSYAQTYATDNNIPFVVLDDEPEETGRGFDLKQDGHCVVNDSLSFSYDGWTNWFGIFGYKIPLERYQEVYGESYTKHIYKQNISEWGGNCFGMSVTAAMFYKDKLPLLDYTHDVNTLTAGGYDDMATTVDGKYFLRLDNDSELTKLIERYQIWQDSDEFYKSRTKDILNYQSGTYADAFSNIVSNVRSTKEPYLVIVRWEDADGSHGHALVIDSARTPEDLGGGWVRLYLYDPNYPYFEYFNDKTPVSNYERAENRFVDVNIQNGQWRMESGINGSQTDGTSIGYDDVGNLLKESQIYFVDVNDYPTNFDVKATFSASGELTAIAYMSDDFKVYDSDNVLIYQKEDGKTVFSEEDIVSEYVPCSYVEGMSDGISEGRLILPKGTYRITVTEGAIAFLEDDDYAGIVSKEEVSIINEDSTSLSISSASGADVNVVIEDTYSDDNFTSIETDIEMDEKGCELSLDGRKLDIQKGTAQELDIDVITEDQEKVIEQISSDDVVDFDLISGICELLGDLNADGRVNITDLMMCLHHVSGRTQLSEERISVADIDGNGSVNITDLMRMLHYVSGRTEAL